MAASAIRDETLPPVRVLTREQRVRVGRLPVTIEALATALETEADVLGLAVEGGPFVRYLGRVDAEGDGPIQVCLPVSGDGGLVMPAMHALVIDGDGEDAAYPAVLGLYDRLSAHMEQAGLTPDGPPREIYEEDRIQVAWSVRPA